MRQWLSETCGSPKAERNIPVAVRGEGRREEKAYGKVFPREERPREKCGLVFVRKREERRRNPCLPQWNEHARRRMCLFDK